MVSVCLPSDALSQHLLSYLCFSYLGRGVSLHSCSSKAQPLLLTLDKGYLLTAAPSDLEHGVAPLGPPVPMQPPLLGCKVRDIVQETRIKTIPMEKKCKNAKWLSAEALQIAMKRREVKGEGEKKRYTHSNAEL